jgi:predicted O-linked N-acetylglucosamine transferase (SPINDLY family)
LRAGVPLVTCPGRSFASRVGASLLGALKMSELICESLDDLAMKALVLAQDAEDLASVRAKLAANRTTSALFDPARFARHLEQGYEAIYERSQSSLPPVDLVVRPAGSGGSAGQRSTAIEPTA